MLVMAPLDLMLVMAQMYSDTGQTICLGKLSFFYN